jgi:hypothetical protein
VGKAKLLEGTANRHLVEIDIEAFLDDAPASPARFANCLSSPALKSVRNGTAAPIAPSRIIPAQEAWNQTASGDGISSQRVSLNEA